MVNASAGVRMAYASAKMLTSPPTLDSGTAKASATCCSIPMMMNSDEPKIKPITTRSATQIDTRADERSAADLPFAPPLALPI